MHAIQGDTYSSILKQATSLLINHGLVVAPRGQVTHELQNVTLTLTSPTQRYPRIPGRNASIFALTAETLWVIAGRADLSFIQAYLPRMADFSDDGLTLSGAYGPRIRDWAGTDQILAIVRTLSADTDSRRAIISLFDPARDHDQSKRDIPCTSVLQFTTRHNKLDLSVFSRSMDIMWASAINFFEWTILQEAAARWLELPIGTYCQMVGSLHIYDEFIPRASRLGSADDPAPLAITPFDVPLGMLDSSIEAYFRLEDMFRHGALDASPSGSISTSMWMTEAIELTRAFWLANLENDYRSAREIIDSLPPSEATAMGLDHITFMERTYAKSLGHRPSHT